MVATLAVGKAWAWELYAMFASIREEAQTIDETEIDAQFELLDALLLGQSIRSPAAPPQTRGNSSGWPEGRRRTRPERHRVVKKTRKKPETT